MTPFTCGCTEDGTERCAAHADWYCHRTPRFMGRECPPCHLARLRSVSLDGRATPTRNRR